MGRNDAELNKVSVIDGVDHYIFTDKDAKHQDTITIIVQDRQALLIDTAFPEYAEEVKKNLESQGIEPKNGAGACKSANFGLKNEIGKKKLKILYLFFFHWINFCFL